MTSAAMRYALAFHRKFRLAHSAYPVAPAPGLGDPERLRYDLQHEETSELLEALRHGDLTGIAHELADIVYVAYGTAISYGIDLDAVLREVHRANMTKMGTDGKFEATPGGKVLKGPGYRPPDVASVLRMQEPLPWGRA